MIEQFIAAPWIVRIFFVLIFLSTALSAFVLLGGVRDARRGAWLQPAMVDVPLLCGFGGTVASLYVTFVASGVAFDLEEAFGAALGSSLYGVIASVFGEACRLWMAPK